MLQQAPHISSINITFDPTLRDDLDARLKKLPALAGTIMMAENRRGFEDTISENILIATTIYAILGALITVGVAYVLQEMGLWAGFDMSVLANALPWLAGILIILMGFGVLNWKERLIVILNCLICLN